MCLQDGLAKLLWLVWIKNLWWGTCFSGFDFLVPLVAPNFSKFVSALLLASFGGFLLSWNLDSWLCLCLLLYETVFMVMGVVHPWNTGLGKKEKVMCGGNYHICYFRWRTGWKSCAECWAMMSPSALWETKLTWRRTDMFLCRKQRRK